MTNHRSQRKRRVLLAGAAPKDPQTLELTRLAVPGPQSNIKDVVELLRKAGVHGFLQGFAPGAARIRPIHVGPHPQFRVQYLESSSGQPQVPRLAGKRLHDLHELVYILADNCRVFWL